MNYVPWQILSIEVNFMEHTNNISYHAAEAAVLSCRLVAWFGSTILN